MDSLIITKGVKSEDLVLGDKNAAMVAARILAYGPEYECVVQHPKTGEEASVSFNLADCPFKKLPEDVSLNQFEYELPVSKTKITFKILNGVDEKKIDSEIQSNKKLNSQVTQELTTRLRHTITSVNGDSSQAVINSFVNNMLARDSLALRKEIKRVTPDIEMLQSVEIGGETVEVEIPMTVNFFWPGT